MKQIQVKVARKTIEAADIASFELVPKSGTLPPFSAGSHIDVHVGKFIRQYSLCNDPAEDNRYLIAVLREPNSRGGSLAMHDQVKEGDTLTISEPRNHFPLVRGNRFLLFAGGIGITPILCMAERLHAIGGDFELHYCTRAIERTAFLDRIKASAFAGNVRFHHDAGPESQKLDCKAVLGKPEENTHIYVCGPGGFISHVTDTAKACGWAGDQIHLEYFGAAAPLKHAFDGEFEVKLASSGKTYLIPAAETVVSALARCGIDIPVSCEQGVCGTCITRVIDGTPDHRDQYFTDDERARNDRFTPCCSRAKSRALVLDL